MSTKADDPRQTESNPPNGPLKRRGLLLGAGAAGAAALAAKTLPVTTPIAAVPVAAPSVADTTGGYRLTAHVLRYYDTARS